MTKNYYADNFKKGADLEKINDSNLKDMNTNGKCNTCIYFKFGGLKCEKRNEQGQLIRPNMAPITYTEQTQRGQFINVLRPADCKDFEAKGKKKTEEAATE